MEEFETAGDRFAQNEISQNSIIVIFENFISLFFQTLNFEKLLCGEQNRTVNEVLPSFAIARKAKLAIVDLVYFRIQIRSNFIFHLHFHPLLSSHSS